MTEEGTSYGLTAARAHPARRRPRPQSMTIDAHAHAWVDAAAAFVAPHQAQTAAIAIASASAPETQRINQMQVRDRAAYLTDWRLRLAEMDKMEIDVQVVLPSPSQAFYTLPPDIAAQGAALVNDGIAEMASHQPDRLIPFGSLPMQDADAAVEELERCIQQRGFKGVQILTTVAGRELSDPAFAQVWAKAEALGAIVFLHPLGFTPADRLVPYYFNNVIGQPLDSTVALHYLIFGGVLERHPALKLIAAHGGGYLGAYSGRMDHAWGARTDTRAGLPSPPSSYLKRLYVDTVVFTREQLEGLLQTFGPDHLVMGTDYPYDMAEYDPLGHLYTTDQLDDVGLAKLAGGTMHRLLGLSAGS